MGKADLHDADGTDVVLTYERRFKDWRLFEVPILLALPVVDFVVVTP